MARGESTIVRGPVDRQGGPISAYRKGAILLGVQSVNWSDLQPNGPNDAILGSVGDGLIQTLITWAQSIAGAGIKLRPQMGSALPAWCEALSDVGIPNFWSGASTAPLSQVDKSSSGQVLAHPWWVDGPIKAVRQLEEKLAVAYANVAGIMGVEMDVGGGGTVFNEPYQRNFKDPSGPNNLNCPVIAGAILAGFTPAADLIALKRYMQDAASVDGSMIRTRNWNPYENLGGSSSNPGVPGTNFDTAFKTITGGGTGNIQASGASWGGLTITKGAAYVTLINGVSRVTTNPSNTTKNIDTRVNFGPGDGIGAGGGPPVYVTHSSATATYSATGLTGAPAGSFPPGNGLGGYVVTTSDGKSGTVLTNSATALTLDATGWVGGTPAGGSTWTVKGDQVWINGNLYTISSTSTTTNANDTLNLATTIPASPTLTNWIYWLVPQFATLSTLGYKISAVASATQVTISLGVGHWPGAPSNARCAVLVFDFNSDEVITNSHQLFFRELFGARGKMQNNGLAPGSTITAPEKVFPGVAVNDDVSGLRAPNGWQTGSGSFTHDTLIGAAGVTGQVGAIRAIGALSCELPTNPSYGVTRTVADGVTNGTTTITSATAAFTSADVGLCVTGSADLPLHVSIASVTNATTAILTAAATGSHSGQTLNIGALLTVPECQALRSAFEQNPLGT